MNLWKMNLLLNSTLKAPQGEKNAFLNSVFLI